ncbi:HV03 protein, partial [Atractosteus spatula]|nr:HV03 protein [Atractosteus spatula]
VQSDIVLSQPGSELKKLGESVKLSCQTSGFSLSSSWMAWIRQKPGTGLEWLGEISPDGNTINYIASICGRFTISKYSSTGLLNLKTNSLQAEDMAVCYCVKYGAQRLTQSRSLTKTSKPQTTSSIKN